MIELATALSLLLTDAGQPAQAADEARIEDIRDTLSRSSLRAFRNSIERGELTADTIEQDFALWLDYLRIIGRGPEVLASIEAERDSFRTIQAWADLPQDEFEALAREILIERGSMQPHYDPANVRDQGLTFSRPYLRWVLLNRANNGPHASLLLASDRGRGDMNWWEEVDFAYWQAEASGADAETLAAYRAVLRGYIHEDFDTIDYQWVQRSTGAEFMRNPSISLAFGYVDEARRLRSISGQ